MFYYRLYFLANNKIRGFEEMHAPDDMTAIEMSIPFCQDGSAMELWCHDRRVHLFAATDIEHSHLSAAQPAAGQQSQRA